MISPARGVEEVVFVHPYGKGLMPFFQMDIDSRRM